MLTSFDVNQETLVFDEIREAGIGGDEFSREHTVTCMRDQVWREKEIVANSFYDAWSDSSVKELQKISRRAKESSI